MTEEAHLTQQPEPPKQHEGKTPWDEVMLGEEKFFVKRGLVAQTIHNEQPVLFTYDEYHHLETETEVKVWKLGMDRPKNQPAIVRLDYGCPCMELGITFHLQGHDCAQQRQLMFDTIADIGIGAVATVSEKTAAGNGHGAFAVIEEATERYLAEQQGQPVPSMEEGYLKRGYFPFDARQHDLVARVLADSVGDHRPVIGAMSSHTKMQHLEDAGMQVMPNMRVELVSERSHEVRSMLRRDAYHQGLGPQQEPGAYLLMQDRDPVRLTPETYVTHLAGQPLAPRMRPRLAQLAN